MEVPGRCCEVCLGLGVWLIGMGTDREVDLRREERSRAPHITNARRPQSDNYPMRRRARRLTTRPRSSWLNTATRVLVFGVNHFETTTRWLGIWMGLVHVFSFTIKKINKLSMLCSTRYDWEESQSWFYHGLGGCHYRNRAR